MDNLQTLTTIGTQNIGPRQAHKKLPHKNAEKTKQMTNMDPTKPTTGEQMCSRMVDSETVKVHQETCCLKWPRIQPIIAIINDAQLTINNNQLINISLMNNFKLICPQYLDKYPSPLTVWVRILLLARYTRYNIMWQILSVTHRRSMVLYRYVIVTDWDRGVQARWTPKPVQTVRRDRVAVDVLKARARVFI